MKLKHIGALVLATGILLAQSVQAQTLVNSWTLAGGGLNPATYGGAFRPATLIPDASASNGATIGQTGLTSGGLGSNTAGAYGGIYTFFSTNVSFTLQANTVLDGVETITLSFLAGDGAPAYTYNSSSLVLNFNGLNPAVAATDFDAVTGIIVDSPIGPQSLTQYTWTWDVSELGASTGFSTSWGTQPAQGPTPAQQHVFYTDITLTQAVPEPSAVCLIAMGGVAVLFRRKRRMSSGH